MLPPIRHRTPLIGRRRQVAELHAAVAAAAGGRGALVLLAGEPGIGKTRLAEETGAVATAAGMDVAWGRCHEVAGRPPLWPWVQILRALTPGFGADAVAAELGADAAPLSRFVPGLRPHVPAAARDPDSDSARFRLHLAFAAFLRWAASQRPQLLVLDDLHWADLPSLRLLEFLSHEIADLPVAVVATFRDVELRQTPTAADLVGSLVRRGSSLAIGGLSAEEAAEFVACAAGPQVAATWGPRLHAITEGNPFFLDEMLRLIEAGGGLPDAGVPLPLGVVATIRRRLHGFDPEVVDLLGAAALLGRAFDVGLVATVVGRRPAAVRAQLTPALALDVVRALPDRPGRLRFAHALVREALVAELAAPRRAVLHRLCAEALEQHADEDGEVQPSEIAHHYHAAAAGDDVAAARALDWAERAGDQAMAALAFEEAAAHFDRAVQLLEPAGAAARERRCDLLLRLGDASNRAALEPASIAAYERAAELARRMQAPVPLARAALGLCGVGATWAQFGRSDERLIAVLREALDALPAAEAGLRARLLARLATELHFAPTPADTDALSREAVTLARATGDAATLAYTLPARLRCSGPEQRDERRGIIAEILALTGGRGELAVHALAWQASEALQAGDPAAVAATRTALLAAVREMRQGRDLWLVPALEGQEHLLAGRLAEAESGAEAMLAHEGLSANGRMAAIVLLYLIRREQGRLGELAEGMRAFVGGAATVTAWRTNLVQLYAEVGDLEAARDELDRIVAPGLAGLKRDNTWMLGAAGLAGAVAVAGSAAQAEVVYDALRPFAGLQVVAASFFYTGPVSWYLGVLAGRAGRVDAARRHLEAALGEARRLAAPAWVARARQALAQWCDADAPARAVAPPAAGAARSASLRRVGDAWSLEYGGRVSMLAARRGLDHLARLLAAPGHEFHVLDLAVAPGEPALAASEAEPVLDARTRRELRARVAELRSELEQAEANRDLGRSARLRGELDAVADHLARSLGIGRRARRGNDAAERARAAVTKALRAAIGQIAAVEPDLGALLDRTVRTGAFCAYAPLREAAVEWRVG